MNLAYQENLFKEISTAHDIIRLSFHHADVSNIETDESVDVLMRRK